MKIQNTQMQSNNRWEGRPNMNDEDRAHTSQGLCVSASRMQYQNQWRLRIGFSFLKFILNLTDTYRAVKREMSVRLLSILYRGRGRRGRKKKGKLKRIGKKGKGLETNNLKN